MMKAIPRFDKELENWVIDVETEEGKILYTYMKNRTINKESNIWKTSTLGY